MATDQYYVSLADSFSNVLEDLAIEVTEKDHGAKIPKSKSGSTNISSAATANYNYDRKSKDSPLQFAALDIPSPDKTLGNSTQSEQYQQDADTSDTSTSNTCNAKKAGGKWHKLRSSVQRKMMEMQEEKKQILSIASRRSGSNSGSSGGGTDIASNAAIAFHLQAQEEDQFQQVLLVKSSNSTCSSTSTDCSELGTNSTDEDRQNTENNQRRNSIEERYAEDILEELSPIEEGEEDDYDLVFSSSDEGGNAGPSTSLSRHTNYPSRQFNNNSGLRAQLEDALFALDIASKEKKVLQGQLDATSFKLGKLRKVIQQRSMENSKLHIILDGKNAALMKQTEQLGILDLALKQSQEKNDKLEREMEQLRRQLHPSMPPRRPNLAPPVPPTANTSSTHIGSSTSVMERVSVFTTSSIKTGAGSSTSSSGGNTSKPSMANAFKESKRFFSGQSSSLDYAKQRSKAYMKLSSPDQKIRKVFPPEAGSTIHSESTTEMKTATRTSLADQSRISAMAKKFNNLQVKTEGREDCATATRNELEAIRQNHLKGKVSGSKSSLEFAFTHPPKTPKTPVTERCEDGAVMSTIFSPLRARIELFGLESPCTGVPRSE